MAKPVERFEELVAWQKARALTSSVYGATAAGAFGRDFALRDQMRRAAVSILSNIAEGFERGRLAEFHQFLSVAKGSCGELRAQVYVAHDAGHIERETFASLLGQAEEVGRIVGGLRAAVERKRNSESRTLHDELAVADEYQIDLPTDE
jgi:four helix bundle protein